MRLLLLLLLLLAIPTSTAVASHWRSGWGLVPAAPAPPAAASDADAIARLVLEQKDGHWQARIANPVAGPLQIRLSSAPGASVPGLPLTRILRAGNTEVVSPLPPPVDGRPLALRLEAIPGEPGAHAQDVVYQLPFEAPRFQVSQPPQGRYSHGDTENHDAIDFALPEATPVLAARAGKVMDLRSGYQGNGDDPLRDGPRANFIRLLHDDGSMAVYAHLRPQGVLVRRGERVAAGQRIGLSGNTGYSRAPHLHFVVQVNAGMQLRSVPVRMAGPRGQLHFAREADARPQTP